VFFDVLVFQIAEDFFGDLEWTASDIYRSGSLLFNLSDAFFEMGAYMVWGKRSPDADDDLRETPAERITVDRDRLKT